MAANFWDNSSTDGLANTAANWSLGNVPTGTDVATFDNTSDSNCLFDVSISCAGINVTADYDGDIDMATFDLTTTGDMTFDGTGIFDCGTGTLTCAGHFDQAHQTIWTYATSTVVLTGTAKNLIGGKSCYNLTISGSYTLAPATIGGQHEVLGAFILSDSASLVLVADDLRTFGTAVINGTLTVTWEWLHFGPSITIGASGSVTGNGSVTIERAAGMTLTKSAGGTWDVADTEVKRGIVISGGTYSGTWLLRVRASGVDYTVLFTGNVIFTEAITFDADTLKTYTIDLNTNDVDVTFQGDVTLSETGGGTLAWTKGTGTITLSGSTGPHTIDFNGEVIEAIVVNKSAGNLQLTGALSPVSFTGTSTGTGDFDPNGQTITTTGNCSWAAAFTFDGIGVDVMNGSDWQIGGNFTADGQDLAATVGWDLDVTGTAVASGAGDVDDCTAGGTEITATGWNDGGGNTNWDFGVGGFAGINQIIGGGILCG